MKEYNEENKNNHKNFKGFEPKSDDMAEAVSVAPPEDKQTEPTTEQWAKLYEAAKIIKQLAPWEFLWDNDLITIMLPGREEPVYCSVMGRIGECYGIGVYPDFDAILRFYRLMKKDAAPQPLREMLEQRGFVCYFGDREEVTPEDRAVYKSLNIKFRGRNEWIYFRALEPGYCPWFIDGEQAELLIDALQNLIMAFRPLMDGHIKVDFENGETLLRRYSEEKEMWLSSAAKSLPIPEKRVMLIVDNDILIAQIKKQKRSRRHLEIDKFYVPMPVQEKKGDKPYMPTMVMLADRQSSTLLDQHIGGSDTTIEEVMLEMLTNHIMEYGRPSVLYVYDEIMGRLFADFCKKTDIKLEQDKGIPVINSFIADMLNYIDS